MRRLPFVLVLVLAGCSPAPPAVVTVYVPTPAPTAPAGPPAVDPVQPAPVVPPPKGEPPAAKPGKYKQGDKVVIFPSDMPPMPMVGTPAARLRIGRERLLKVVSAGDFRGAISDCDGVNLVFCRAGTEAVVFDTDTDTDGIKWVEVRLKSGPLAEEKVWLTEDDIGQWSLSEKQAKEIDEKRWPKEKRKAILRDYLALVEESLKLGAAEIGGRLDPDGKLALRLKRLKVEEAASKHFYKAIDKLMVKHDIDFPGELDAIVVGELAAGERTAWADR